MTEIIHNPLLTASDEIRTFLASIPDDPGTALVLADYLQEHGDANEQLQGELLHLVYTLTRAVEDERRTSLENRMRELLRQDVRAIGPCRRLVLSGKVVMDFTWVPCGTFLMGSPLYEKGRAPHKDDSIRSEPDEGPMHEVTLTRGFWMGTTPLTQAQYAAIMDNNPSWNSSRSADVELENRDKPVQEVTWEMAVEFLQKLTMLVGKSESGIHFRLPTEAEWEYACRAGTTTRFWSGDSEADLDRVGWYGGNSPVEKEWADFEMHPVGKAANAFGLFDVHGNVWEWCADVFDENFYARSPSRDPFCTDDENGETEMKVIRGGDAWDEADACRSGARNFYPQDCSHNDISIRVVTDQLD